MLRDPLRLAATALQLLGNGRREPHMAASLALVSVAVICMGGGGAFAVAALTIYLIPILGAAGAALVVAGTLITIACVALAVSEYLSRRPRGSSAAPPPDLAALAAGAEGFVRDNKALSLAAALVAGLLVANEQRKPD
jgi:hypothetical protein